ncbi:MAG: 7-alpha-hydroxysteroid dehydrogenase [Sulfuricurvum sp. GWF2_44_89]|uniref:7-alpha-hydroxysteroid dehydrogenase n=1 Tax=Sulfuricurvum kujiense TaxID=148813 RepID=A0A2D3WDB4_9BACT|nr:MULTISPECIES: enoyl-ACP reductase [Sulfuricurvum]OHD79062.1 MAG: 7-alpha-hydroxysteroid dehydrogenase [Sulfuricurvum sp. GWF2_44_89]OHD94717.1 MAG: 7-alpha-hydroxysteroid dehydrogenase [Sulfuricurvum sp. RIFOXYD12_FULL_44_77]OHD97265.1 MAG: 7-alpha-hydroxysteroid dehydrogenase [Sulfuricurvum sp. RIFOXYD2_FULL_44_160]DAB37895.1 MAG TPA: 7-alpha-hydroxysteroid dehydrogenase [Sulfuricurvum kujiense]
MQGKTLLISGGTRGIGKAIVYAFASKGVNVAFTYNSNAEIAQEITDDIEKQYGVKCRGYALNILEPDEYKEVYAKFDEDFDRLDFFISNAIISGRAVVGGFGPFMRLKPKGLNNIYTATVNAFVVGAQEAAKRMEKVGGGSIISMSSTGNLVYTPNYAGHGTNKAAVEAMVRYAAAELGEKGIRVNAVSGGPIDTDALKAFPNYEEVKGEVVKRSPLSRMGEAEDLTGACLFLCGEGSSWLTGQTIVVDGGTTFQ